MTSRFLGRRDGKVQFHPWRCRSVAVVRARQRACWSPNGGWPDLRGRSGHHRWLPLANVELEALGLMNRKGFPESF